MFIIKCNQILFIDSKMIYTIWNNFKDFKSFKIRTSPV